MSEAELRIENKELRLKLQQALARAAEMENNPELKAKMEVGAKKLAHPPEKKVDAPAKYS